MAACRLSSYISSVRLVRCSMLMKPVTLQAPPILRTPCIASLYPLCKHASTAVSAVSPAPVKKFTTTKPATPTFRQRKEPAAKKADVEVPLHNKAITFTVRVVDEDGKQVGVMPGPEAWQLAVKRNTDLVLISRSSDPPVCKLTPLASVMNELKRQESVARRAMRDSKPKEMRFTARISDHDLSVKVGKIVEFLRDGRPVKVIVSFTMSAWMQEEPLRREIMSKVVRKVGESGAGHCDATSIKGEGANLQAMFNPTSTPKPAAEVEKVLAKLAVAQKDLASDSTMRNVTATVKAAMEGTAAKATVEHVLPPPSVLAKFRTPTRRTIPGADDDADVKSPALAEEALDMGITPVAARRKSKKEREREKQKGATV